MFARFPSAELSRRRRSGALIGLAALGAFSACHGMNPFAADLGKDESDGRVNRPPYMSQVGYFGHVGTAQPSRMEAGQAKNDIYLWLPTSTPELGVRFLSQVNGHAKPNAARDTVEEAFSSNSSDKAHFDPAIAVSRCLAALELGDVTKPCPQWVDLGDNDDSPEMPADADGKYTNSLVRIATHLDDPLKALVRGLYRVTFTAAKGSQLQGNYVMQLGAPVMLDHVAMARTPEALAEHMATHAPALPMTPSIGHVGTAPARAEPVPAPAGH